MVRLYIALRGLLSMYRVLSTLVVAASFALALFIFLPGFGASQAQTANSIVNAADTNVKGGKRMTISKELIAGLTAQSPGVQLSISESTGAASFVRVRANSSNDLAAAAKSSKSRRGAVDLQAKSLAFFNQYAGLFGIADPSNELVEQKIEQDQIGGTHETFQQFYKGVPVYAALVKTHFDKSSNLYAAAGNSVPEIDVDVNPSKTSDDAAASAIIKVSGEKELTGLKYESVKLFVFRTGLVQGIPGEDRLVWEVTVTGRSDVREFVYIDAHTGKFVDQYTGITDALVRRAFDYGGVTTQPTNPATYTTTATPFWVEGQAFPTGNAEADNMLTSTSETYNFYKNAFGRDAYDNAGHIMDSVFNRGYSCPNASWNGYFISFCPGLTTDDVTSHEWSHAYTQFTHGLIYAWQPGALNEGYSDVFGETVDRINRRDNVGNSATDPARTADTCTIYTSAAPRLRINSPAAIAGEIGVGRAAFGPALSTPGVTGDVVLAQDAADAAGPSTTDGCSALTNAAAVNGKIAFIDRGTCGFKLKTLNAQNAGAIGVIVANISTSANALITLADDATITTPITIPVVQVLYSTGNSIRAQFANGVNATLKGTTNTDASTRWLVGEDDTGALTGALRDMYNPTCYANPGKVSDTSFYSCGPNTAAGDYGGVHGNSGVINHGYALLVDGGTYNGQTINAIGLTKAAHIYFRAESVYQNPASDFSFHADALVQSANDLIGTDLNDLSTGAPSGQIITAADIAQVQKMTLAVELKTQPTFCNFAPMLAKTPPAEATCTGNTARATVFGDDFEGGNTGWTVGTENTVPGFSLANWATNNALPDGRAGTGYFVPNPYNSCDAGTQDQTGLRFLKSPTILVPASYASTMTLRFDHWFASELNYDGGQVAISINGGAFTLIPAANYAYNAPTKTLITLANGNSNPRAGQLAYSGADDGGISRGTWGTTVVNLQGLVIAGSTVQLRYDFGNDSCGGSTTGWYVDNFKINACITAAGPTAAASSITGRILTNDGRAISGAVITVADMSGNARTVKGNSFGNFKISELSSGQTYTVSVKHKSYTFTTSLLSLNEDLADYIIRAN